MSKKQILIAAGLVIVLGLAGGGFYFWTSQKNLQKGETASPLSQLNLPLGEKLLTYRDEAGFSFQYPSSLGVVETEANNTNYYSSLELSNKDRPGEKMTIKIMDTTLLTPEKWLEKNKPAGNLATAKEISLGKMAGKEFSVGNPPGKIVVVIDNALVYLIDYPPGDFWSKTTEKITGSFALTENNASGKSTTSSGSGGGITEEEEEIIE